MQVVIIVQPANLVFLQDKVQIVILLSLGTGMMEQQKENFQNVKHSVLNVLDLGLIVQFALILMHLQLIIVELVLIVIDILI